MINHEHFMHRAIELASATVGQASPNPQVGCVLVREGKIIAEGAHLYDLRDHAEIVALKQAGEAARGATAYVTLEPCSHQGRTGPCADALIAAGIARCVVATVDPNPQVAGRGIAKLRAAGIETQVGVLQAEAQRLNDAFAWSIQNHKPFVTLKAALSVDGMLAPPPATRNATQPFWLTGSAAREHVQQLRHSADAILTGIGTVLADDPLLTDRSGKPRRRPLLRVVFDADLRTPLDSQLVRSAQNDLLILCAETAHNANQESLEFRGVEVSRIPAQQGHLDLPTVLNLLNKRQILSALLEAGSQLNGAFLTADLVQRVILFYAETELGPNAIPFAQGIPSPFLLEQRLNKIHREAFGPDACVTGDLHTAWPR